MIKRFLAFLVIFFGLNSSRAQTTTTFTPNNDAFVTNLTGDLNANYATNTNLYAYSWTSGGVPYNIRSYIGFNLSSIPTGAKVCSAVLTMYTNTSNNQSGANYPNTSYLKRVTSSWSQSSVTWSVQPSYSSTDTIPFGPISGTTAGTSFTIDVTSNVQNMVSSPSTNYGWAMMLKNESNYYASLGVYSSDYTVTPGYRPVLSVTYVPSLTVTPTATTVCYGKSTNISVSGASTYSWTPSTGLSTTTGTSVVASPTASTTYTITGTTGSCSTKATSTITVSGPVITVNSPTLCIGNSTTLSSTISPTSTYAYVWTPTVGLSGSGSSMTATPTTTTVYTITATPDVGCAGTTTSTVTVNSLPNITITPTSNTLCAGQSVTLTASGANTYTWSANAGSATTATVAGSPTVTTTYSVTGTNTGTGCANTQSVTVNVNALPSLTITPSSQTICSGSTINFSATGANTYTWTPNTALTCSVCATPTANPTSSLTYTITGTNTVTSCFNTKTAVVTVNATPTLTVNTPTVSICKGNSTTLTITGSGSSYSWTPSIGLSTSTGTNVVATPTTTTVYTITATLGSCTGVITSTVTVNPTPTLTVNTPTVTICSGNSTTLTVSGSGTSYSWTPSSGLSATTGTNVVATPTATTVYTITATLGSCTGVATSTITVNPTPTVTVNSPTICFGNSSALTTTISPLGTYTYAWSPSGTLSSSTTASVTATPTITTIYTITVTSSLSCVGTKTSTVTVNATPTLTVNTPTVAICSGKSTTLTVTGSGTSYSWTPSTGLSATTGTNVVASPTATTIYTITATLGSCTGVVSSTVTVNTTPTVTVTPTAYTLCSGGGRDLSAGGATSYSWTPSTGLSATTGTLVNASPTSSTIYTVTGTTGSCSSIATSAITINPTPALTVNSPTVAICNGNSTTLTVSGSGTTYSWTPLTGLSATSGTNVVASPTATTIYAITATLGSCTKVVSSTVTVNSLPSLTITPSSTSICIGSSASLTASGANTYSWSPGTGLSSTSTASVSANPTVTTTYTLTGTSSIGCTSTKTITITVNPLPTIAISASPRPAIYQVGKNVVLTASGASTYTWATVTGLSSYTSATVTASPTVTTTYTVTGTDANTCVNTQTINLLYSPLSFVSQTSNVLPSQLQNSAYILVNAQNGFPPYHYYWNDNASTQSNRYNITPGVYSLVLTDSLQDTVKTSFSVGTTLLPSLQENIKDSNNIFINTSYSTSVGAVTFDNYVKAGDDGYIDYSLTDTASVYFLGFGPEATDTSNHSYSNLTIKTTNKYISRSLALSNPTLLSTYDTLVSSYSDSIKVKNRTLVNMVSSDISVPVTNLHGMVVSNGKLYFFIAGSTYQKAVPVAPGDALRVGRLSGALYLKKNNTSLVTASSSIGSLNLSPHLYLNSQTINHSLLSGSFTLGYLGHTIPVPCFTSLNMNSVQNRTYDENGNVASESMSYFDYLGRNVQTQARVFSQNNTLVTQNLFDGLGRTVGQTLPAPDFQNTLCYQPSFVTSSLSGHTNQTYGYADFDMPNTIANSFGQTNNPSPVANTTSGTLGWYYSNSNTTEPFVAASGLPYNRVEYFPDPTNSSKKVAGVGEDHAMGSTHENSVYNMANAGELDFFYGYHGSYQVNADMTPQSEPSENLELFKTVTVNADGKEDISYTNSSGRVIASCISGSSDVCVAQTVIQNLKHKNNGSTVIHLPKSKNNSLSFPVMTTTCPNQTSSGGNWCNIIKFAEANPSAANGSVVFNLTDLSTGKLLTLNTDYTISNGKVTFTNGYQNKSLYLRLNYDFNSTLLLPSSSQFPDLAVQYSLDYSNWTLNYYDTKEQLITNVAPTDVNCTGQGQQVPINIKSYTNIQTPVLPGTFDLKNGNTSTIYNNIAWSTGEDAYTYCFQNPINPSYNFNLPTGLLNNAVGNLEFHFVNVIASSATQRHINTQNTYARSVPATIATPGLTDTSIVSVDTAVLRQITSNPQLNLNNQVVDSSIHFNPLTFVSDSLGNIDTVATINTSASNARFSGNVTITYSVNYNVVYKYSNNTQVIVSDAANNPINYPLEYKVTSSSLALSGSNGYSGGPLITNANPGSYSIPTNSAQLSGMTAIQLVPSSAYVSISGYPNIPSGQWFNLCTTPRTMANSAYTSTINAFGTMMDIEDWAFIEFALGFYAGLETTVTTSDLTYASNQHTFSKQFTYDNYNRLVSSKTADEGKKDLVYDSEDKLRFSQNDEQRTAGNGGRFTYVNYDRAARPVETGEYDPTISHSGNPYYFQTEAQHDAGTSVPSGETSIYSIVDQIGSFDTYRTTQQTYSAYDLPDAALNTAISNYSPTFLPGKVAKTWNDYSTSWYSYDELGRLNWTVQQTNEHLLNLPGNPNNQVKTFNYLYNLQGNLLQTVYQKETSAESFYHKYDYDADQRLTKASTSFDGSTWTLQDKYYYYLHGPLKREEIQTNLQGIDYVYTVGGMLKGINDPGLNNQYDPGQDGYTSSHSGFSNDVFGFGIDYYPNDYVRNNSNVQLYTSSSFSGANNLYSGLIKDVRWKTQMPTAATGISYTGNTLMYEYNYDDKYRLSEAIFGTFADQSGGNSGGGNSTSNNSNLRTTAIQFTQGTDYHVNNITYDLNGNLQTLRRYSNTASYPNPALTMDDLTYKYDGTKKNKLLQVSDAAISSGFSPEVDIQDQSNSNNYAYNNIGQIISNVQDNTKNTYDVYGQVSQVNKNSNNNLIVKYKYNDKGLRAAKLSYDGSGTLTEQLNYVYDATGSLVCTYETDLTKDVIGPVLKDYVLYGASRLGIYDAANSTSSNKIYYYEMNDHLGNVRAVYTKNSTTGLADVSSFTDFYPHGSPLPGRNYVSAVGYRYNYQGQEKDAETGLLNFELRQFDPRLSRWFAPDPMGQYYSPYLAMGNNPVNMIDPTGGYSIGGDQTSYNPSGGNKTNVDNLFEPSGWTFITSAFQSQFNNNYDHGG